MKFTVKMLCRAGIVAALYAVGSVEGVDKHVRLLVAKYVAADSLAEHGRVAVNVEIVVLQLESESHLLAELIKVVGIGGRCVGENSAYL